MSQHRRQHIVLPDPVRPFLILQKGYRALTIKFQDLMHTLSSKLQKGRPENNLQIL